MIDGPATAVTLHPPFIGITSVMLIIPIGGALSLLYLVGIIIVPSTIASFLLLFVETSIVIDSFTPLSVVGISVAGRSATSPGRRSGRRALLQKFRREDGRRLEGKVQGVVAVVFREHHQSCCGDDCRHRIPSLEKKGGIEGPVCRSEQVYMEGWREGVFLLVYTLGQNYIDV